jgi:hypothetical protein
MLSLSFNTEFQTQTIDGVLPSWGIRNAVRCAVTCAVGGLELGKSADRIFFKS